MEENEPDCGKCMFWSMWTGECMNTDSEHLLEEKNFYDEPCDSFEWEESFIPKDDESKNSKENSCTSD